MSALNDAVALARRFEGLRLSVYRDVAGVPTIGYGHVCKPDTPPITEHQADVLLATDMDGAAGAVTLLVPVPLTDGQIAALADFVFNLGALRLQSSTLRRRLVSGDYGGAADEFGRWVIAGGRRQPGLIVRREAERRLFVR